jgi:hypothetical protein
VTKVSDKYYIVRRSDNSDKLLEEAIALEEALKIIDQENSRSHKYKWILKEIISENE